MLSLKQRHTARIRVAQERISKYKEAIRVQYQAYRAKYDAHAINKYDWANVEAWKKEKEAAANENYRVYRESIRENYDKIL